MSADHEEEGHGRWAKILTFIAGIGFVAGIMRRVVLYRSVGPTMNDRLRQGLS